MSNNNNSPNNGTIYPPFPELISHSRFKAPLVTLLVLASGTFAIWQSLPEQTHALTWLPIIEPGPSGVVYARRGASEDFEKAGCITRPTCGSVS
jgi:hypothetical protein